jgi:phospholipid transport system substrate-binding protein
MTILTRRRRSFSAFALAALIGAAGIATGHPAFAVETLGQPGAVVNSLDQSLIDIMQQAKQLGYNGRYAKLEPVLRQAFDIRYMTQLAVGPGWSTLNQDQQDRLADAFGKFITATYARRFDGYSGERFETLGEKQIGQATMVQTRLVKSNGEAIALNYVARQNGARWQVVDIYLTGTISEMATRRSEFAAVFSRSGYAGLLQALQQKVAQIESDPHQS